MTSDRRVDIVWGGDTRETWQLTWRSEDPAGSLYKLELISSNYTIGAFTLRWHAARVHQQRRLGVRRSGDRVRLADH
jgi:hypothetical protein